MNQHQLFAYEHPNEPSLIRKNENQLIRLKGLLLSSVITVDSLDTYYVWHASISVLEPVSFQPIHANKVSYCNKLRVRRELEKLLERVGARDVRRSESLGSFHLFRYMSKFESLGLSLNISKQIPIPTN